MRVLWLLLFACLAAGQALTHEVRAQEAGGISSPLVSRCAGKAGTQTREADPAFLTFALDGVPWLAVERTPDAVGNQPISTTVTGSGWQRRKDGTTISFRFTCVLDADGQALMFHISHLMRSLGDELPPSTVVEGAAAYLEKAPLPRGIELRVQLLDISKSPTGEVLAEQVVRSGWQVPIPFALRLPRDMPLAGHKLQLTARVVLEHQILFELKEPRLITADDLHKYFALTLDKVRSASR
jgi:uncharacterized lipoprotein YbaY